MGRYPAGEIAVAQRLVPMPASLPVGMPSELLERRPDVIAAERRVAAAFSRVGEAKAARLPRLSLTAGGSSISSDLFVIDLRVVEQRQIALYSARTSLLRVQAERLAQRVNLYLALGGSFDSATTTTKAAMR